jgi:hypothetical protein
MDQEIGVHPPVLRRGPGEAERRAALDMIRRHAPGLTRRLTCGGDKGQDSADFDAEQRQPSVTPHMAQKARGSAIDGRTTRRAGCATTWGATASWPREHAGGGPETGGGAA